jgi:hypothetical protein
MLVALDRQLVHIEENLSTYFSPNTHLTGEALALYVTGVALPELARSRRWRDTGRRILLEEIARQIHPDGGHVERSTHYHRYTLDFYLMALLTARRDGDALAARQFTDAATRLAEFALVIADSHGRVPLIGDDDGGMLWPFGRRECQDLRDSLATAAVLLDRPDIAPWGIQEETYWIIGAACDLPAVGGQPISSRLLPDTGYVVMRNHNGSQAVFDVGRHGFLNGGHAHADALSITLTLDGRPLMIDPGTATYTVDARVRDRFRLSASHNTLTIDGRSQSRPGGPFQWHTRTDAVLHDWRSHPHIDWAEASHDGYAPVRHRRSVLRTTGGGWLVVDEVLGAGPHEAESHWHVDPLWALHADAPGRVMAIHADGSKAWMLCSAGDITLARGDTDQSLGWHSPVYGAVAPSWSACVTRVEHAPFTIITWIGSPVNAEVPRLEQVLQADGTSAAIGAIVKAGERSSVFLVRTGCTGSPGSHMCHIGGYSTDARVFHCVEDSGTATHINLIDAGYVRTPRSGISIESSDRIPDLHVSLEDGILDLLASQPPSGLVMQVPRTLRVTSIRLNQRPLPRHGSDSAETFRVHGADW